MSRQRAARFCGRTVHSFAVFRRKMRGTPRVDFKLRMSIKTIPRRDAFATFAGYVFQVNVTILRWLELAPQDHLELETGEDIDLVQGASGQDDKEKQRVMEQLKQKGCTVTLRNSDSLEAIANYCRHLEANPGALLRFRFLTTAAVTKERSPWRRPQPAIELWEGIRLGRLPKAERPAALVALRDFLNVCPKPAELSADIWAALERVLADADIETFDRIVDTFEWATESGNHEVVEQVIREELQARDPDHSEARAKILYRNLFSFVINLLSRKGQKELTRDLLNREMAETSMVLSDHLAASTLRSWIAYVDAKLEDHESRIEELERRTESFRVTTFFVPQRRGGRGILFDFNQTLRGRRRRLEELTAFAADREARIAVLSGRGGVGKTKLLLDWAQGLEGWRQLWVNAHGKWSDESATEIPHQDTVLILDDAHQYSDLGHIIDYVANAPAGPRRKLVIATRPSGQSYVDEAIARDADESFVRRFDPLREPGPTATFEIAEEMLGTAFAHFAEALARVSADTPLITVVGGRLIARGQIGPELLANDTDFRNAVFAKFAADCEGDLPAGGGTRQELLHLVSAVQPVLEQDDRFADRAAAFLSIRPDQVWQGLDDLEQRGVLVRGRGGLRIAPDLFGDYLLESASVTRHGVSTGFADAVFSSFGETHLSNLLKNFAELDWRITQRDPELRMLDGIWDSLYTLFRSQNAIERERFLGDIAVIAVFQPERVERIAQIAMDEPVESVRFWSFRRVTQDDVFRHVSPLLGVTIFHEPTSRDAFERLWRLAQHSDADVHNAARKALKDAIAYRKYKSVDFNERILSLVEEKSTESVAYQGNFTPLTLIDEILEREVDDHSYRGKTFSFTALPVNYAVIAPLRARALRTLCDRMQSSEPRVAVLAAESLARVVAEFHPKMRSGPSEEEQAWQDDERLSAIMCIEQRIDAGGLPLPLVFTLRLLLGRVMRRANQSAAIKSRAAALLEKMPTPPFIDLFYVMCTNEYEDGAIDYDSIAVPAWRQQMENRAFEELSLSHPEASAKIDEIDRLVRSAVDAGIDPESLQNVLTRLCQDRAFLAGFSDYVLEKPGALLASQANFALNAWRDVDPEKYLHYGVAFARSENLRLARAVALSVSYGPPLQHPIPEDVALLTVLSQRTEGYVLGDVVVGLRRLMQTSSYEAVAAELYANLRIGSDKNLANHYCQTVGSHPIPQQLLNRSRAERILANLIDVDELERDAIGGMLARLCGVAPIALVRFFEARIERRQTLDASGADSDYEPIPSSFSWSTLAEAREASDYPEAIAAFIALMRRYPDLDHRLAPIFWHMAALDTPTLSGLDMLLHSGSDADIRLLIYLLHEASKGLALSHPIFAMHVLSVGAELSEQALSGLRSVLFSNAMRGPGMQVYAGPIPPPPDSSHVSPAEVLSRQWAEGSMAHEFFAELARAQLPVLPRRGLAVHETDEEEGEDDLAADF